MVVLHHPVARQFQRQPLGQVQFRRQAPFRVEAAVLPGRQVPVVVPPHRRTQRQEVVDGVFRLRPGRGQQHVRAHVLLAHLPGCELRIPPVHALAQRQVASRPDVMLQAPGQGVLRQARPQRQVVLRLAVYLVLLLAAPVPIRRGVHFDLRLRAAPGIFQQAHQVVPAHHLVRSVRRVEAVAVLAPQERRFQRVQVVQVPVQFGVGVAYPCAELVQAAQQFRQRTAQRAVLPRQRRHAHRGDVGEPLADGALRPGARKEVVQGEAPPLLLRGRLRDDTQVGGGKVPLRPLEAALAQFRALDHLRGDDGRQAEDVGVAVHRHPVQREQVVARAAAAHVHRRRAVRARGHARQALCPADGVALAQRRGHRTDAFQSRLEPAQAKFDATRVRLHRCLQRVAPGRRLGMSRNSNQQNGYRYPWTFHTSFITNSSITITKKSSVAVALKATATNLIYYWYLQTSNR